MENAYFDKIASKLRSIKKMTSSVNTNYWFTFNFFPSIVRILDFTYERNQTINKYSSQSDVGIIIVSRYLVKEIVLTFVLRKTVNRVKADLTRNLPNDSLKEGQLSGVNLNDF